MPRSVLGELYGERAVQGPCIIIAGQTDHNGIQRTKFGGIVIAGMCDSMTWERWKGTAIFIPQSIEVPVHPGAERIDQMMLGPMSYDNDIEYWREVWRSQG